MVTSAAVHVALLAAVLAATITIAGRDGPRRRLADVAIEAAPPVRINEPVKPADANPRASGPGNPISVASLQTQPAPALRGQSTDAQFSSLVTPAPTSVSTSLTHTEPAAARAVSFAGVKAHAARRIVYVVDASGSMVNSYAFVRARLIQSINRLSPTQRFTIVLARTQPGSTTMEVLPTERKVAYLRGIPSEKDQAVRWLRDVVVGGRSSPLEGLESALSLDPKPDLVFLLSRGFKRTDSGAWTGVEGALAKLDVLNPMSARTGRRAVIVKTLQFLDDDPTGLMEAIGNAHGDGPGSSRVLTMADLSREDVDDDAMPPDPMVDASVMRARVALMDSNAQALEVLYGLAMPEARERVRHSIDRARAALGPRLGAYDEVGISIRARADLLDAALTGDAHLASQAQERLADMFIMESDGDAARRLSEAAAAALAGDLLTAQTLTDQLERDLVPLHLPDAIESELGVLRSRFGLTGSNHVETDWELLRAEAQVQRVLDIDGPRAGAFDPLFSWAGDRPDRFSLIASRISVFSTTLPKSTVFEPRVQFAQAIGLVRTMPTEAAQMLLSIATNNPGTSTARESLWEAAVVLERVDESRAADVLEQFASAWPDDARAADAIVGAIAHTPAKESAALRRRLVKAMSALPTHEYADRWRVRLAMISPTDEAMVLLGQIHADSPLAEVAADQILAIVSQAETSAAAIRMGSRLLRSLGDVRWQDAHAILIEQLIATDASAAAIEAQRFNPESPRYALLLAQAQLAAGRQAEALRTLDNLTREVTPDREQFWSAWKLILDILSQDPSQADAIRAHLYRLRLIDPSFEIGRWEVPGARLVDAPSDR